MTFQQLQYLLEVSNSGSVTKAAKKLFVSYSSISISISNLEKELGYPLFTRTQKGLVPTPQGEKVLVYANQICQAYSQLNAIEQESKRTVRISCVDKPYFANAYAQLVEETIGGDASVVVTSAQDPVHGLILNELDLNLRMLMDFAVGYWDRLLKTNNLQREVLKVIPAVIQVGKTHRLYNAEKVFPYELKNDTFVDTPDNPLTKSSLFNGAMYTDPSKILYAAGANVREALIRRGLAYAICTMPPANQARSDDFRYIPLEGVNYHLLAITNPNHPVQPEVSRFLQLLKKELELAYPESKD